MRYPYTFTDCVQLILWLGDITDPASELPPELRTPEMVEGIRTNIERCRYYMDRNAYEVSGLLLLRGVERHYERDA